MLLIEPGTRHAHNMLTAACALCLQELSGDARDWVERDALVHAAMEKFRLTLRSRPDFDRGCYNLGTVFYTFAMALQGDAGGLKQGNESRCVIAKFVSGGKWLDQLRSLLLLLRLGGGVMGSKGSEEVCETVMWHHQPPPPAEPPHWNAVELSPCIALRNLTGCDCLTGF